MPAGAASKKEIFSESDSTFAAGNGGLSLGIFWSGRVPPSDLAVLKRSNGTWRDIFHLLRKRFSGDRWKIDLTAELQMAGPPFRGSLGHPKVSRGLVQCIGKRYFSYRRDMTNK